MPTAPRPHWLGLIAALAVACAPSGPLPLPVQREVRPGDVYELVLENGDGTRVHARAEARVTVGSRRPDATALAVLLRELTLSEQGTVLSDERLSVSVDRDPVRPTLTVTDGDRDLELLQGLVNTFDLNSCVLPARPHAAGDTWTEAFPEGTWEWHVGVPELEDGVTWVRYRHIYRGPGVDGAPGLPGFEAELRIRVDDGFTGECRVKLHVGDIDPAAPVHVIHNRIQSRRAR